jgi:CRISPR-associated protein Csd1
MLLEQLVAYADKLERQGNELPFMYQEIPVKWLIHLDQAGVFQRFEMTSNGLEGKKNTGKKFPVPHLSRQGAKAKLLCDDAPYVLSIPREKDDVSKVPYKHELFKQELLECYEITQLPEIKAILAFLETLPTQPVTPPEGFLASESLTFVVSETMPIEDSAVKTYWASKFSSNEDADADSKDKPTFAECLISGEYGPVMRIEPLKIKGGGIPNGQTSGMNIVSTDKDAFGSYGLKSVSSAPIRLPLAVKYANALNTLLRDPLTHLRVGPAVYAFWTKEGETPPITELLKSPSEMLAKLRAGESIQADLKVGSDSEQIKKLISSAFTGRIAGQLESDEFYAACFSASGSRVVLRDHLTSTVQSTGENLARYFETQTMIATEPMGVFELSASLYRDANKELTTGIIASLLENALKGTPLPHSYLIRLASRNRAEQRITKPRAVLTRMTLISIRRIDMDELIALQPDHASVGYQLGRLMAALESLQYAALGKLNSTVVDRFYGSLSSTPIVAYSRLMAGARNHVSKLGKENGGAAVREEQRLQQIHSRISSIPARLDLEEQALFSLGYYHEKADRFAQIQAAKDLKTANSASTTGGNQ